MTTIAPGRHILAGLTAALLAAAGPAWADDAATTTEKAAEKATAAASEAEKKAAEADKKAAEADKKAADAEKKAADAEKKAEEKAAPPEPKHVVGDVPIGSPDAPVTIIEYASFTCPHCARFHGAVWDQLKKNYIDTGKVRFILREVYFDKYGLWASMTARCAGPEGFYPMADIYLKTQHIWTRAPDLDHAIHQIGRRAGVSAERLAACLSDREYAKALLSDYKKNAAADNVRSTPTFFINGEKAEADGGISYEDFAKLIDAKL